MFIPDFLDLDEQLDKFLKKKEEEEANLLEQYSGSTFIP